MMTGEDRVMTLIRTTARVEEDGTVTVPVGAAEAGKTVEVIVTSAPEPGTINGLPREEWYAIFKGLAGSIDDPGFQRPAQEPYEPKRPQD
jgi:hypothetical protein